MVEEIECDDNPERIKYHPDGSTLAVQCDNGSVYLHRDDCISRIAFAPGEDSHVTAEMAWGRRNILFASTACYADGSGRHKAYDVLKNRVAVEFDAGKEACSTLALCPEGESLFIATEGPNCAFALRQFDVRRKAAVQKVELEPFVDITDRTAMDVNSLSVSADGLYVAAGRTDNWADVYDTRMLTKGPLYSFAHEGVVGHDSFGVVKTQWVDGAPHGVGLITGGVDGCVRLWDVRRPSDDPLNGTILAQCEYDVATFTLGDPYRNDVPIIVGEKSGQVTIHKRTWEENDDEARDDQHET
ncbi:WD40-repeat-containing domain protein [Trametes meyenii]|nr:WD40-repeat-containing domain protein [Trametes meyenii]